MKKVKEVDTVVDTVVEPVVEQVEPQKEFISAEDLKALSDRRERTLQLATAADKAVAEAKIASLEFDVLVRNLFIKYGLTADSHLNQFDGQIVRPESEVK
jgi:hypothetical protein